ncbi:patatin-like phospholipase family protein [Pelomonas sp. CA6]|uniref:patatin-like phospholipase family protein n=1 Tax=Pelomonas sp. CA6 TaxID=2907999 RepID=UPI001F4C384D|nr:patatin-like phospholipase family protein [Pelomonas sp. CA6]MCH7343929.1 patatin-like phospholipase family protein [Pelomonas sp. CA6]
MTGGRALQILAGPKARERLRQQGLRASDVRVIPAAAGGPKGLVLNALDRFLFGHWLPAAAQPGRELHLLGASIGAWRMATACLTRNPDDVEREFERLAQEYAHQRYDSAPGRMPDATAVTRGFAAKLDEVFGGREQVMLSHPSLRLHVFTSRGRHLLRREGRLRTPLGYAGAFAANAWSRSAMGGWLERVVFSDPRAPLPMPLHDYRSRQVALDPGNLQAAVLASCSIPFWLRAVHDIAGAPAGAYWDGGITDYHLHLNYAAMVGEGLVLYPHFQREVIPGWLDKGLRHRHRPSGFLDNVVLLVPDPDWVRQLPNGKLPDRADFQRYGDDIQARARAWLRAVREAQRLADELAEACNRPHLDVLPL